MLRSLNNTSRLFTTSCFALILTAMTFALRASLEGVWGEEFGLTKEQLGWVFSPAFWGFTLTMAIGGPLCDLVGARPLFIVAFLGHLSGILFYLLANSATGLFLGTLAIGIGNGMVEAACNPLIASLYPDRKTEMLNRFHVWFPGGIVIGGLIAYTLIDMLNLNWRILVLTLLVPGLVYGIMIMRVSFPKKVSEASKSIGDTFLVRVRSIFSPLFVIMILGMLLSAATELGTNQWIGALLSGMDVSGILILVFINSIMAIGRSYAGPVVHRLSPAGMLIFSSVVSCIGLLLLSVSEGHTVFVAALVFAIGICFFWPTMLGFVSEYLPKTGAMGLSFMGGAGMLSVSFLLPIIGKWYDNIKSASIESGSSLIQAEVLAGSSIFTRIAVLPAILIVLFIFIYYYINKKQKNTQINPA